ncbi:MAG: sugar ABC transporter permease [Clostridiales bacterium]|nr:sugar ABC transporter permease [Clostridiales bacterium]
MFLTSSANNDRPRLSRTERVRLNVSRVVIWFAIILTLYPAVWILMASFAKGESFFMKSLFPKSLTLSNYAKLLQKTDFITWVINTLKISFAVTIVQIILTATAAYAFSRMRFVGRKRGLMSLILLQVFPSSMAVAGYYTLVYRFGLVDSSIALILVLSGGSAFNIWLLKSYIDTVPKELDESAFLDGAGHFRVFIKIILPLALPQITVISLFSFIAAYSEYVIASIFIQSPQKRTLALGMQMFLDHQFAANWTLFAAAAVLSSLPIMIIFMMLQNYIQSGLTAGGIKE